MRGYAGPDGPKGQKGNQGTACTSKRDSALTTQIQGLVLCQCNAYDQVIMDWMDNQVSGAVRGLLDPEASQDLQASVRKVTKPVMELYLVSKLK